MIEHEYEPIRGLPGQLPPGETITWQGAPEWRALARRAFGTRIVAGYFAVLAAWALVNTWVWHSGLLGFEMTVGFGLVAEALLHLFAWLSARTTVYTLTNRRIVLRIGIAVPKCVNLPLGMIRSVDLALHEDATGDIALAIAGPAKLGIAALWPHARPWHIVKPQPMLRGLPDAEFLAAQVARACRVASGEGAPVLAEAPASPAPALAKAAAA